MQLVKYGTLFFGFVNPFLNDRGKGANHYITLHYEPQQARKIGFAFRNTIFIFSRVGI